MAFRGTGLPDEKSEALSDAPRFLDADKLGSATIWANIARTGARLAEEGADALARSEHQATTAATAQFEVDQDRIYIEKRREFANKPKEFKAWHDGHVEGALSSVPSALVPRARVALGKEFNKHYNSILGETEAQERRMRHQSFTARLQLAENDVLAAAASGIDANATIREYKSIAASGVADSFIAPDEMDRRIEDLQDRAIASSTTLTIKNIYQDALQKGEDNPGQIGLDAADRMIRRNPDLRIKESKREYYYHKAAGEIRALEGIRRKDLREVQEAARSWQTAMVGGVQVGMDQIESVAGQLMALGDKAGAMRLHAAHMRSDWLRAIADPRRSTQEATALAARSLGFSAASPEVQGSIREASQTTGVPLDYLVRTASRESSFDPNARARTSSASGLFQFTNETWETTLAKHGAKYGLGPNASRFNARANALMAGELAKDNKAAIEERLGREVTWGEVYVAHFAGADGATKLLSAGADVVGSAILPRAAEANREIFYHPNGRPRTVGEITAELTRTFAGMGRGEPQFIDDPLLARATQKALSERANKEWKKIKEQLDAGHVPAAEVLGPFLHAAKMSGDADLVEEVAFRMDRASAGPQAARAPEETASETAQQEVVGVQGGLTPAGSARVQAQKEALRVQQEERQKNPIAFTQKWWSDAFPDPVTPVDWGNGTAAAQNLQYRQRIAKHAADTYPELGTTPPLDAREIDSLKARWDGSTPDQKIALLDTISRGLDGRHMAAVLKKIGVKDASMAAAGGLYPDAPDVAAGIIRGKAALDADPRYVPPAGNEKKSWDEDLDKKLPVAGFTMGARQTDEGAVATIRQAIKFRYADLSARAGDTEGRFKEERLDQAIRDVTGGTVTHNGQTVIAPRRGMDQAAFDKVLAGVSDTDLAGVTTLSGAPITARYLRGNARLVSFRDGQYLVQVNQDNANPMYATSNANTEMPGVFVLDLRRIRPQAIPLPSIGETPAP